MKRLIKLSFFVSLQHCSLRVSILPKRTKRESRTFPSVQFHSEYVEYVGHSSLVYPVKKRLYSQGILKVNPLNHRPKATEISS